MLSQPDCLIYLSVVSLWEIAIKSSLGKLELKSSLDELLTDLHDSTITITPIASEYLKQVAQLPWLHKDPFDRLIIATAKVECMTIVTADENVRKYDVHWIW